MNKFPASWTRWALAAVVVIQIGLFAAGVIYHRRAWLYADNFYYETPAWNLVTGHGYSIETTVADDPYLTLAYRARHPEADTRYVPAATLPAGYGFFLAGVYSLFGRSHLAAILANCIPLLATVLAFAGLLQRRKSDWATAVTLALMATFPGWAFWSSVMMSDILHVALLALFALVWFHDRPSLRRSIASGLILAVAAFVRPYALLVPFVFLAWYYIVRRIPAFAPRQVLVVASIVITVNGAWTVRNYHEFGKLIPVTAMGGGRGLFLATFSRGFMEDIRHSQELNDADRAAEAAGIQDWHRHDDNLRMQQMAVERIGKHPGQYLSSVALRSVRLWISAIAAGVPGAVIWAFIALQAGTFAAMVAGMWSSRKSDDPVLAGSLAIVLYYWLLMAPVAGEARATLPARGFAFILAGVALAPLARSLFARWIPGVDRSAHPIEPASAPEG